MKKPLSKVAHNQPHFFSVLPTGPKPVQICDIFHRNLKSPTTWLLYNDFACIVAKNDVTLFAKKYRFNLSKLPAFGKYLSYLVSKGQHKTRLFFSVFYVTVRFQVFVRFFVQCLVPAFFVGGLNTCLWALVQRQRPRGSWERPQKKVRGIITIFRTSLKKELGSTPCASLNAFFFTRWCPSGASNFRPDMAAQCAKLHKIVSLIRISIKDSRNCNYLRKYLGRTFCVYRPRSSNFLLCHFSGP